MKGSTFLLTALPYLIVNEGKLTDWKSPGLRTFYYCWPGMTLTNRAIRVPLFLMHWLQIPAFICHSALHRALLLQYMVTWSRVNLYPLSSVDNQWLSNDIADGIKFVFTSWPGLTCMTWSNDLARLGSPRGKVNSALVSSFRVNCNFIQHFLDWGC